MTAVLLGQHEPNTPEWDRLRSKGLGGSEIAAVVGLSPWESRFSLYHRKRGTIGRKTVNAGMDWGTRLEDAICEAWQENHPTYLTRKVGTYRHAEHEWQIANLDRLVMDTKNPRRPFTEGGDGILEVKTAHQYDAHEWGHGPEDVPPYYRCQVVWYMDVLGVPEAHLAVLIGGSDYREYLIPYLVEEAEWLREEGRKFWSDVQEGNAPDIDGHDATYEAVRNLHPEINGEDVVIDGQLYADYAVTKKAADEAATRHKAAKSALLDEMGQAKRALIVGPDDMEIPVLRRQPGRNGSVSLYLIQPPKFKKDVT